MRTRILSATLLCLLGPYATAADASAAESRQDAALWLTQQLHRPVEPAQILVAPRAASLEGCSIMRMRPAPTGATSLSLHCPAQRLPQLVLLKIPLTSLDAEDIIPALHANRPPPSAIPGAIHNPTPTAARHDEPKLPPLVRAGATLEADWRTPALHAELPVVALESGPAGAEIRVRIAQGSRILRARILTAHTVSIVEAGA